MNTPEAAFLLRRLIALAEAERDLLHAEDWEAAIPVQEQFDEAFAQLQVSVAHKPLTRALASDVERLLQLQDGNIRLARELQRTAGTALGELAKSSRLSAYAPLGTGHTPGPRYLDQSA